MINALLKIQIMIVNCCFRFLNESFRKKRGFQFFIFITTRSKLEPKCRYFNRNIWDEMKNSAHISSLAQQMEGTRVNATNFVEGCYDDILQAGEFYYTYAGIPRDEWDETGICAKPLKKSQQLSEFRIKKVQVLNLL